MIALLAYEWIGFVLGRFPYTRPWGEGLVRFLAGLVSEIVQAVVGAVPGIVLAVVIFVVRPLRGGDAPTRSSTGRRRAAIRLRWLDCRHGRAPPAGSPA